jgi:hypothetical protein
VLFRSGIHPSTRQTRTLPKRMLSYSISAGVARAGMTFAVSRTLAFEIGMQWEEILPTMSGQKCVSGLALPAQALYAIVIQQRYVWKMQ